MNVLHERLSPGRVETGDLLVRGFSGVVADALSRLIEELANRPRVDIVRQTVGTNLTRHDD